MRPITVQSGFSEADFTELLESRQFVYCECFTILPVVGSPMRYTSWQRDVAVIPCSGGPGMVNYVSGDVIVKGLRFKTGVGIEVDEQTIEMSYAEDSLWQAAISIPQALRLGRLDGAIIRRDRFYAAGPGTPWVGGIPMFVGLVSNLNDVGRQSATISVKSSLILLNQQTPRDLWQPQCKNTWGDGKGCPVLQEDHVVQTTVASGSTRNRINWAGVTDDFVMGKCYIEGSDDVTRIRTILAVSAGSYADLIFPLDFDPVVGSNVAFYPNCRRQYNRCGDYNVNPDQVFIGFPFVPVAETAA